MKKLFSAFLFVFVTTLLQAQMNKVIDVQRYSFRIELSDSSYAIKGEARIQVKFIAETDQIQFDLVAPSSGKGMNVKSVTGNGSEVKYTHQGNKLRIMLPKHAAAGDTSTFVINYEGIPATGLVIAKNKFGQRSFYADNWPDHARYWIPCHDDPFDKASVDFIVIAPEHYQVVANGIQVEETNISSTLKLTHWKEEVPLATKVMAIGVADFAVSLSGIVDCIPVYSWVFPEEREKGFYDYGFAPEILAYFISTIGPYGYKKLANVQSNTSFGALENASAIFYAQNSVTGTGKGEGLLAHEIAHQWFGNMATEISFAHLWLSEGFATYFSIMFLENKYGADTATKMRRLDRTQVIDFSKQNNHPVVDTFVTDYMQLLNANSYQKGGWVLHMLRRELGDSVFFQSIREYYSLYAGKNADTENLQKVFEKATGKDLQIFFRQWLYQPGQPEINITWKAAGKNKAEITITQLQPLLFQFPLEVAIHTVSGNTTTEKFSITKKQEIFSVDITEKIQSVVSDPSTSLLFHETIHTAKK